MRIASSPHFSRALAVPPPKFPLRSWLVLSYCGFLIKNVVYVIESALCGVIFTSCLCQNPNERDTSQWGLLTQTSREYDPVQSTSYDVSCLLHVLGEFHWNSFLNVTRNLISKSKSQILRCKCKFNSNVKSRSTPLVLIVQNRKCTYKSLI